MQWFVRPKTKSLPSTAKLVRIVLELFKAPVTIFSSMITRCFQISPTWVLDMPVFSMYSKYPTKLSAAQIESLASQLRDCFNRGSDEDTFQNLERTFKLLQSLRMKYLSDYVIAQFFSFHEKELVVFRSCNSHVFSAKNALNQWYNIHLVMFLHTWHFALSNLLCRN